MPLKLKADPTFKALVPIPIPGGEPENVGFTFKHRTVAQLEEFEKTTKDMSNRDVVLACVTAWDLDDEFTPENVDRLLDNYHGAARVIFKTYLLELAALRLGN
jgi:Fe-S-cluster formation regulator IscX/YfhJ